MITSKTTTASPTARRREALRVMLVDDDPFELEVISALLAKLGMRDITKAVGAQAALRTLASRHASVDLMLTDLHMPGMDGFEFMAAAAKLGFAGAWIIVSGQTAEVVHAASLVAQLRRLNLLGTVQKPATKEALSSLIPL